MNRKILFFLCLSDRGGAEISMIRLAQGLLDQGREVVVAAYGLDPPLAQRLGFRGEIIDLGVVRTFSSLMPLARLVKERRFDVLISALTHTNLLAIFVAKIVCPSLRIIATEHGIHGMLAADRSALFRTGLRYGYARAFCVVFVSRALEKAWSAYLTPQTAACTIYNPVVEHLPPRQDPVQLSWMTQGSSPIILGIGRLKKEKNFSLLVRAFARARAQREMRLVILGEGVERSSLEQLIKSLHLEKDVLLPGFVEQPKMWLAQSALFVCPSEREGFGNVVVEALAAGVSVIATDCPGPVEILENGRFGTIVGFDEVVLAKTILSVLDRDCDKEALRRRAQDFTTERCINAYTALIDRPFRSPRNRS